MNYFISLPYDTEAPKIDYKEGVLKLYGHCIPSEPDSTLSFLFEAILLHIEHYNELTILFKFDSVNTSSSKKFSQLFNKFNAMKSQNKKYKINIIWSYPKIDEDMQELGEFYKLNSDTLAKKGNYPKINFKLKSYNYD
jgi:hypothetical protein